MANIFQIKRRITDSNAAFSLAAGELAYHEIADKLFYGAADGSIKEIGGKGTLITLATPQTVTEAKTFTGAVNLGSSAVTVTHDTTDNSSLVANTAFVQNVASLLDGGSF